MPGLVLEAVAFLLQEHVGGQHERPEAQERGGTSLPLLFRLSPANVHDAPFARPLLELAERLFGLRPRVVRLDAGY